ncbi:MAG: M15 family metallopeptidase [Nanoarchaeota archaeon]|nr:M15 family metallopeptidase [Nanoarchaeota archaeon]
MYNIQIIENIKRRNKLILDKLDAVTSTKFSNLYTDALNMGILLLYFSGYRDLEKQNQLYQKYLRGEGGIAAKPGYSWHNYGRAVDLVPVKESGENDWNSKFYPAIDILAKRYGLKWMGWQDSPHFTDSRGETIEQLIKNPPIIITKTKRLIPIIIGISLLALFVGFEMYKRFKR